MDNDTVRIDQIDLRIREIFEREAVELMETDVRRKVAAIIGRVICNGF